MFRLDCKGRVLTIDEPVVMGIINCTPDSFYANSRKQSAHSILEQAGKMISEGAAILDLGGQSTRPGSEKISIDEELRRVIEPISRIRESFPDIFISIDTYYAEVAQRAVEAGADMVNDISAAAFDQEMIPAIIELKVPYILMHMKGTPQTMLAESNYVDVVSEVYQFLDQRKQTLHQRGIKDIIVDPGFGFAKNISQNFALLRNLSKFTELNAPLLLGISRKSTIYKTLGTDANAALNGTTVLNTIGLLNGANILRVHDVKEAREAIQLVNAYKK